jgi:plasmid stability protein
LRVNLDPGLEAKLRTRAEAEGLSVTAYIERLIADEDAGIARTEILLQEAAESGDRIELTEEEWDRMEREALAEVEARSKRRA